MSFFSKKIKDKLINFNNTINTSKKKIIIYLNYSGQRDIIKAASKYNDNRINFLKSKFKNLNYKKLNNIRLHSPEISKFSAEIAKISAVRKILKKYLLVFLMLNVNIF